MKKNRMLTLCTLAVVTVGICVFTNIHTYATVPPETGGNCLTNPEWHEFLSPAICVHGECERGEHTQAPLKKPNYDCRK